MITLVRLEGYADSPESLKREFETLLDHVRMAGYLEGVTPQASRVKDVYESLVPDDEDAEHQLVTIGGRRYYFEYAGRAVCKFSPTDGMFEHGPVLQSEFTVFEKSEDGSIRSPSEDLQSAAIVLERRIWPEAEKLTLNQRRSKDAMEERSRRLMEESVTASLVAPSGEMTRLTSIGEAALVAIRRSNERNPDGDRQDYVVGTAALLTANVLAAALADAGRAGVTYRTLLVGSEELMSTAQQITDRGEPLDGVVSIRWDRSLGDDEWMLTSEVVEP